MSDNYQTKTLGLASLILHGAWMRTALCIILSGLVRASIVQHALRFQAAAAAYCGICRAAWSRQARALPAG